MSLKDQITEDMKTAMRAKDSARLGTIRLLQAAMKQKEVDERIELDDTAVIAIVDKLIKQRKDSIAAFEKANRQDLADIEIAELKFWHAATGFLLHYPHRHFIVFEHAQQIVTDARFIVVHIARREDRDLARNRAIARRERRIGLCRATKALRRIGRQLALAMHAQNALRALLLRLSAGGDPA